MHEDPTRRMDVPPRGEPPQGGYGEPPSGGGMSTGAKVAIGILVAAVLGLVAALAVVASDSGSDDPTTTSSSTTSSTTTLLVDVVDDHRADDDEHDLDDDHRADDDVDDDQHRNDVDLDDLDGHRPRHDHRGRRRDRSALTGTVRPGPDRFLSD